MGRARQRKWQNRVIAQHEAVSKKSRTWKKLGFAGAVVLSIGVAFGTWGLYSFLTSKKAYNNPTVAKEVGARIQTSMGDIEIRLFPDKSPRTVGQFVKFAKEGKYDGLIFHRVIKDFVIQGGDPNGDGTGGNDIQVEEDKNDLKNLRGTMSMAKTSGSTKVGMQFFINLKDNTALDQPGNRFYPFGDVIEGMDVIDKIAAVPVDENDRPKTEVKIIKIIIGESQA